MSPFPGIKAALPAIVLLVLTGAARSPACGPELPNRLLDRGGVAALDTPEFFFELEMRDLAKGYPSDFKADNPQVIELENYRKQTADADAADYADALKTGEIVPKDAQAATTRHHEARAVVDDATPDKPGAAFPDEFPGEFAEYDRGAFLFRQGKLDDARKAWEGLLALPKEQRHYRSTWAAFMLGKLDLATDNTEAGKWFEMVRELAKDGYADTTGLAASSYSWEAFGPGVSDEKAAALCLQQVSTGDRLAFDGLKGLADELLDGDGLQKAAANPLLRRLVTSRLLAGASPASFDNYIYTPDTDADSKAEQKWLAAVEKTGGDAVQDADRIGWIAYSKGDYTAAARWLKKADPGTALSLWLSAKLDFRAGKMDAAIASMQKAVAKIPVNERMQLRDYSAVDWEVPQSDAAQGDLGMLLLERSEFTGAFKAFLTSWHWRDASYVAERLLTPKELIAIVDKDFPQNAETEKDESPGPDWMVVEPGPTVANPWAADYNAMLSLRVRYLLARRLVRLGRCEEARPYFPKWMRATLDEYAGALRVAGAGAWPKKDRAGAFWKAAQLARKSGMELMGTEVEPDAFLWDGAYEEADVAGERLRGKYEKVTYYTVTDASGTEEDAEKTSIEPLVLPASKAEKARLAGQPVKPNERFHYRFVAANLAWEAAQLLPDNDEQTALVLNTAGSWIKDRDDKAADRFYQAIEKRCPATVIGRKAVELRWFAPMDDDTAAPQQQ